MVVKAYLRGDEEAIPLTFDYTTIGRSEACDVVIQDCHLDLEHCTIEFCECENKVLLTDLNTASGTFVNGNRVHNSVVELSPGDLIQFGNEGKCMKLIFTSQTGDSFKERPKSAGSTLINRQKVKKFDLLHRNLQPHVDLSLPNLNLKIGSHRPQTSYKEISQHNDVIREKDKKIIEMREEINRLSLIESELLQKNRVINAMKEHSFHKLPTDPFKCSPKSSNLHQTSNHQNSRLLFHKVNEEHDKNEKLRSEMEDIRRSYQSSQGLTHSLQNELSNKEILLSKNSCQLESLKKQLKLSEQKVSSLSSKCSKLIEENKTDKLEKQLSEMKSKWKTQETRLQNQIDLLQNYKNELLKATNSQQMVINEKNQANKEANEIKQKYFQLQRSEKILKVDLEQTKTLYDKFRTKISYLLSTSDSHLDDSCGNVPNDGVIINKIQKVFLDKNNLKIKVKEIEKALNDFEDEKLKMKEDKDICQKILKSSLDTISVSGQKQSIIENEAEKISNMDNSFSWVAKYVTGCLYGQLKNLQKFERTLLSIGRTASEEKSNIDHLLEVHKDYQVEKENLLKLENSLEEIKSKHEVEKKKLSEEIHENLFQQHNVNLEQLRDEHQSSLEVELKRKLEEQKLNFDEILEKEKEELTSAKEENEKHIQIISEKNELISQLEDEDKKSKELLEELKQIQNLKTSDLAAMEEACQESLRKMQEHLESEKDAAEVKVKQYEEESKQHSLTIVALEKKLQDFKRSLEAKRLTSSKMIQTNERTNPVDEEQVEILQSDILSLRSELFLTRESLQIQEDQNRVLLRDLRGAESRLSDMTGELSESLKEELEHNRILVKNLQLETNEGHQKLFKMTEVVEEQKKEIEELKENIKIYKQVKNKTKLNEKPETRDQICEASLEVQKATSSMSEPRCHGERHIEVIMRQREALAELREQVKALEQIQGPLPGQEQALKQVVLLKKELAEIRAKNAVENQEENDEIFQQIFDSEPKDDLPVTQQLQAAQARVRIEKSTREQLNDSVMASEQTYMDLISNLQFLLGIKCMDGNQNIAYIPPDEQARLCLARKEDLEKITKQIKDLLNQLEKKEGLLQDYEKDLRKLRETEEEIGFKSEHLEKLRRSLIEKSLEVENLRRAYKETNEKFESEKRLNKMIKLRKAHRCKDAHPVVRESNIRPSPPTSAKSRTKKILDMKKRRDYEFEVLKQEKEQKEKELYQTTAKLVTLQNSLKKELIIS